MIIDNCYFRIKSIFGYRLGALVVAYHVLHPDNLYAATMVGLGTAGMTGAAVVTFFDVSDALLYSTFWTVLSAQAERKRRILSSLLLKGLLGSANCHKLE